jgi:hypothetical protein
MHRAKMALSKKSEEIREPTVGPREQRHGTFRPVSDVSGDPLRLGLFCGAPLPVVTASPEVRAEPIELPIGPTGGLARLLS